MRSRFSRIATAGLALGLVASACSSDGEQEATGTPESLAAGEAGSSSSVESSTTTAAAAASSETTATTAAASSTITTAPSTSTTSTQLGSAYSIGPAQGETMDVVGVAWDDVLNFRTAADPSASIVDTVAPFSSTPAVISQGDGWLLANSAWWRVTEGGQEAWANTTFLGQLGATTNIFGGLSASMPSLSAPDLDTLAENIGSARSGGPVPLVVFSTEPVGLDAQGGEATIDVIGLGDDSVKGERISIGFRYIVDDINAESPQVVAIELISASAQVICGRGLSGGLCL